MCIRVEEIRYIPFIIFPDDQLSFKISWFQIYH